VIESLRRRAGRFGLDIILISVWEGSAAAEEAERYCGLWGIEGTVLLDTDSSYARELAVRGVPTNVFVDDRGTVRGVGASTFEELLEGAVELEPRLSGEVDDLLQVARIPFGFARESG
jgi:hypothetical protein